MSGKWAPDNAEGLHAYVVTRRSVWDMGRGHPGHSEIVYCESLPEARRHYGYTRELHTTVKVRRATPADVTASDGVR